MSDFDPYHKWLGISPKDQPPNHYRLLGIDLFESDPEVIASAADLQMTHVRSFQLGKDSDISQKLLNEIAASKVCLLNAEKKAEYDSQLRQQLVKATPLAKEEVAEWHIQTPEGEEFGPVTKSELDSWVAEQRLDGTCRVRKKNWHEWKWAGDIYPELPDAEPATAQPRYAEPETLVVSPRTKSANRSQTWATLAAIGAAAVLLLVTLAITSGRGGKDAASTGRGSTAPTTKASKPLLNPDPGANVNSSNPVSKPPTVEAEKKPEARAPETSALEPVEKPTEAAKPNPVQFDLGDGVKLEMVRVPAGEFTMGDDKSIHSWQKPAHKVNITKPFYLGKYEVTRGQFRQFVASTDYKTDAEKGEKPGACVSDPENTKVEFKEWASWRNVGFEQTDEHPVVIVSWNDAVAFCEWLSRKEGKGFRLPTEAEWEHAFRAGSTTKYSFGDDETRVGEFAWYKGNAGGATHPVGQKKPNAWGLYDMDGNAQELCADWFDLRYYGESPADDPPGPSSGTGRVRRGGAWIFRATAACSAYRDGIGLEQPRNFIGFRVARTLAP